MEKFLQSVGTDAFKRLEKDAKEIDVTVPEYVRNVVIPFFYKWKDKVTIQN